MKHLAWRVDKFIALHDTTVDGWGGEFVRRFRFEYPTFTPAADKVWRARVAGNLKTLGWGPRGEAELTEGLWPALAEFLDSPEGRREWEIMHHFANNNGLTVLRRVEYGKKSRGLTTQKSSKSSKAKSGGNKVAVKREVDIKGKSSSRHGNGGQRSFSAVSSPWKVRQPCSFDFSPSLELRVPSETISASATATAGGATAAGGATTITDRDNGMLVLQRVAVPLSALNSSSDAFLRRATTELSPQFRDICRMVVPATANEVQDQEGSAVGFCVASLLEQVVGVVEERCSRSQV